MGREDIMSKDTEVSELRHRTMSSVKSKDTDIEIILRKALWKRGFRYRKNDKKLPGKPDIVLSKYKIAIFCDAEFWHGKDWYEVLRPQIMRGKNSEYWEKKITNNMNRDMEVNKQLMFLGWTVIRFWGKEIKKNTDECVKVIEECIFEQRIGDFDYQNDNFDFN